MPVYLYKCKKCGKEFEYEQHITDEALTHCPKEICEQECKGEGEVFRKISKNVGLVFNGKGFYITDYAHKHSAYNGNGHHGNGTNGKTEKSGKKEPAKSADNTTETKA